MYFKLQNELCQGAWVAQVVKRLALGFGSGCDLRVLGWTPTLRQALH